MTSNEPPLDELVSCVAAPALDLRPADGQLIGGGAQGSYINDRRLLTQSVVAVDGRTPTLREQSAHTAGARYLYGVESGGPAERTLTRTVELEPDAIRETFTLTTTDAEPTGVVLELILGTDLAELAAVRAGTEPDRRPATVAIAGLRWRTEDGTQADAVADPTPHETGTPIGRLGWEAEISSDQPLRVTVRTTLSADAGPAAVVRRPTRAPLWSTPAITDRIGLGPLVSRSLDDLTGLLLADPDQPADHFVAAGSPWYLTLFGRDALWTARMLLPLGTDLAGGTLRALARRQGRREVQATAEEPGKILHELRRGAFDLPAGSVAGQMSLPGLYYGTVDATALWIGLLHDAWRWGLPVDEVAALLDPAERALAWLRDFGTGPTGFVEYADATGQGLANQGWKDSPDAVRFADGTVARAPIALCEVQAYAYEAAMSGAALLDAFDRSGADEWRAWAEALKQRFRQRFWVDGPHGAFPAIALDGEGRPADTLTSNIGHLLGTGLLDSSESAQVAGQLGRADLDSGFGLRTLSADDRSFDPLSYHRGSVWAHDTAITVAGLARDGHHQVAASLALGLLHAAPAFQHRLPELYAGFARAEVNPPQAYPSSCRPQAWSAAAGVHVLRALLGVRADAPNHTVSADPVRDPRIGALRVCGLRIGASEFDLAVDAQGTAETELPPHPDGPGSDGSSVRRWRISP